MLHPPLFSKREVNIALATYIYPTADSIIINPEMTTEIAPVLVRKTLLERCIFAKEWLKKSVITREKREHYSRKRLMLVRSLMVSQKIVSQKNKVE